MRKLVVCCDGTWNTMEQRELGVPIPTNVARLYFSLDPTDQDQLTYYHPGVGTSPAWWRNLIEGMFGSGIDKNIKSGYRWLCDQYQAGDQIFLFGFSRGAYTARSLGGFLSKAGILDLSGLTETQKWARIDYLYQEKYRNRSNVHVDWAFKVKSEDVKIRFVGVWDTVGALGVPDDLGGYFLKLKGKKFHDTDLGASVQTARHALAIDEQRASFTPTLWTNYGSRDVKQLWFPGVHSDVGGGYIQTGLSDGALEWMVNEATAAGLRFDAKRLSQIKPNHQDVLHDSYTGPFTKFKSQPRTLPNIADKVQIHGSGINRNLNPAITEKNYKATQTLAVGNSARFSISSTLHWNTTGVFVNPGERYILKAEGEWLDSRTKFGPLGMADGKRRLVEIVYFVADFFGYFESKWRGTPNNLSATRRHFNLPWFSLVGVVADGGNPKDNGTPPEHHVFLIGHEYELSPTKPGYLYAYANDLWACYKNNSGSVSLTIERSA